MNRLLTAVALGAVLTAYAPQAAVAQANGHTTDPAAVAAGAYKLDKTHARLQVSGVHMGFSRYVFRIDGFDADLTWNGRSPAASTVSVTADPRTVNTGLPDFDKEIGESFFGGSPISFVSRSAEARGPTAGRLTGDLTVNGVTRPTTFDVTFVGGGPHPFSGKPTLGFSAVTTIKRSDFKIAPSLPASIFSDEVEIRFDGEFNRQ
jgi:polyisoprenoid-binding protein YceI